MRLCLESDRPVEDLESHPNAAYTWENAAGQVPILMFWGTENPYSNIFHQQTFVACLLCVIPVLRTQRTEAAAETVHRLKVTSDV